MNRRKFGLFASSSLVSVVATRPAAAQSATPDPNLLKTTLTPMGGERAGNADGSIPAWTGGLVTSPISPTTPVAVRLFEDEQPLFTVDASNMAQYQDMLSEGTKAQIQKFGLSLKVYPSHRTAAWPQYVYDNTALNATNAQFDPRGGRFGFVGAYGGAPFPIINTAEPLIGGAQLIWNHLTSWVGYSSLTLMSPGCVVIDGNLILVSGAMARTMFPYYDPNGSLATFNGYYSKGHYYTKAPSAVQGQELLIWHSTNVNVHPDIIWTLLNGQGRVRKAPNENYDSPNPDSNGIATTDESSCFYGNPSKFDWTYITKKEMLIPYNCNAMLFSNVTEFLKPHFPDPNIVRWEKHRVWVVEATLHPGERNVTPKRRFYIDEDSWYAVLGEGYDPDNELVKAYVLYLECIPSLPGLIEQNCVIFSLVSGDYAFNGNDRFGQFVGAQFIGPLPASDFDPQSMAASASF